MSSSRWHQPILRNWLKWENLHRYQNHWITMHQSHTDCLSFHTTDNTGGEGTQWWYTYYNELMFASAKIMDEEAELKAKDAAMKTKAEEEIEKKELTELMETADRACHQNAEWIEMFAQRLKSKSRLFKGRVLRFLPNYLKDIIVSRINDLIGRDQPASLNPCGEIPLGEPQMGVQFDTPDEDAAMAGLIAKGNQIHPDFNKIPIELFEKVVRDFAQVTAIPDDECQEFLDSGKFAGHKQAMNAFLYVPKPAFYDTSAADWLKENLKRGINLQGGPAVTMYPEKRSFRPTVNLGLKEKIVVSFDEESPKWSQDISYNIILPDLKIKEIMKDVIDDCRFMIGFANGSCRWVNCGTIEKRADIIQWVIGLMMTQKENDNATAVGDAEPRII